MRKRIRGLGFTLVELLVVIGIIGLLLMLLVPVIASAMRTVRSSMTRNTIKTIEMAIANFRNDFGAYPPSRPKWSPNDDAGTKGKGETGASNLCYYLRGPDGGGWGMGAGGLMPFAGSGVAKRVYGPYYQSGDDRIKFGEEIAPPNNIVAQGFLDDFQPSGVILYFRSYAVPSTGTSGAYIAYDYKDNNPSLAFNADQHDPGARTTYSAVTVSYPQTQAESFYHCVMTNSATADANRVFARNDYLLISPGPDGRYGYTKTDTATNTIVPANKKKDVDAVTDDVTNW